MRTKRSFSTEQRKKKGGEKEISDNQGLSVLQKAPFAAGADC